MSTTPAINEKFFETGRFSYFLDAVEIDENPGKGLITGVNDTGNNISPVTTTPAITFLSHEYVLDMKWPRRILRVPGETDT